MIDWDKLKIFYQVAKYGSFTKASAGLNISQPSLSRQIMILEERMHVKLFYRESRGISLTEEGKEWFDTLENVYKSIENTEFNIAERSKEPKGHIKIASTSGFVSLYLSPVLKNFLDDYPNINLSIVGGNYTADTTDLKTRQADVLIHPYINNDDNLIQRYLMTFHENLYASTEYLEKFGTPKIPQDLDNHRLMISDISNTTFKNSSYWHLEIGRKKNYPREPYLTINTSTGLFNAAQSGLGIISLPDEYPDLNKSNLIRVLPCLDGPTLDAYFIYLKHMKGLRKIDLLVAYLEQIFRN